MQTTLILVAGGPGAGKTAFGRALAMGLSATILVDKDALASTMPFLPGVQTASEAMRAVEFGFRELKFYPAKAAGGLDVLSDFSSIFRGVSWCPTGKVARDDVAAYLALPSVLCCGGSWVAPQDLQSREDWAGIEANARSVAGIKVSPR